VEVCNCVHREFPYESVQFQLVKQFGKSVHICLSYYQTSSSLLFRHSIVADLYLKFSNDICSRFPVVAYVLIRGVAGSGVQGSGLPGPEATREIRSDPVINALKKIGGRVGGYVSARGKMHFFLLKCVKQT